MKNFVFKLAMICLFSGCYAVFVAWENGGFSQLHDFQAIESNGISVYLHQTSPIAMQAEKTSCRFCKTTKTAWPLVSALNLYANKPSQASGLSMPNSYNTKTRANYWYFRWTIWKTITPQKPYTTAILHRSYPKQTERRRGIMPGVHF